MTTLKEIIPQEVQNRMYEITSLKGKKTDIKDLIAYINDARKDGFKVKGPSLRVASQKGIARKF